MSKSKATPKVSTGRKAVRTMTLDQVNGRYNPNIRIPAMIRKALDEVGKAAIEAKDLADLAEVSTSQLAAYEDQFEEFLVAVKKEGRSKIIWTGNAAFAQELRESLAKR